MNNDLISREALKKEFTERINANGFMTTEELLGIIDNAPSVYPICEDKACKYRANERLKGEWIFVARHCYKCPFCQELSREGNFCPNCGAKMKGGAV